MPTHLSHMSPQEYLRQMKIPEAWDNNSYKGLLIEYLLEEEARLSGRGQVKPYDMVISGPDKEYFVEIKSKKGN